MTVTAHPIQRTTTLHELLDRAASAAPQAPAVRDTSGVWTYRELVDLSRDAAAWLYQEGVRPGDRVLVRLPNRREILPLLYGLSRIGAVFVPVNPAMKDFHLRAVVADATPVLAVVAEGSGQVTGVATSALDEVLAGMANQPSPPEPVEVTPDDLAIFIYTSGSTAKPKAVMLPQGPVAFAAAAIQAVLGYRADDVVFCRVPLSFDYGLYQILLCALAGAELVLAADEPEFRLLQQIRQAGATVFPAVPSLAAALIKLTARDPGETRLRMVTNTGAALPQPAIDGLRAAFPGAAVVRMYGTTECKRITVMPPEEEFERPGSVGPALPGTEVSIVDADGAELPAGSVGEIVVSGPHVMAGYWNLPELTARTFRAHDDGVRLHTGDYGYLDADGYLYFSGRRDDMFKRKGTRMSSVEIEAAALDVPGVRAAAVLPPADGRDLAIVVAADGLAPVAVLRALAQRLEPAKVPVVCRVIDEFPLTLNGKSAKQQLTALVDGAGPR